MSPSTSLRTPRAHDADAASEPSAIDPLQRQRAALRSIIELSAERLRAEEEIEANRAARAAEIRRAIETKKAALSRKVEELESDYRAADERTRQAINDEANAAETRAKAEFANSSRRLASEFDALRDRAKRDRAKAETDANGDLESGRKVAAKQRETELRPVADALEVLRVYRDRLAALAADYLKFGLDPDVPPPSRESYDKFESPADELFQRVTRMTEPLKLLEKLVIPKSMKGANEAWVYIVGVALMLGFGAMIGVGGTSLAILAVVGLVIGLALRVQLVNLSTRQLERLYKPLVQSLADAEGLAAHCRTQTEARHQATLKQLGARHAAALQKAKADQAAAIARGEADRDEGLRQINETYARKLAETQAEQTRRMKEAIEAHDHRMAELRTKNEAGASRLDSDDRAIKDQIASDYESGRTAQRDRWRRGVERATADLNAVAEWIEPLGVDWANPHWDDQPLPRSVPPALRFGTLEIDPRSIPGATPADDSLAAILPDRLDQPALRAFPSAANLLVETPPEGRDAALGALQSAMMRLLVALPPGMVRFTIIDPIGIGRGFGAFMHLADFDEALVNQRVWTDSRQIEERLADLEAHMELVTQKYLRNEYRTIEEYNAEAGEVAEPYRVVVVADYPAKFDEKAAGRLAAIVAGGAPCGVLTLVAADVSREFPLGGRLDDLRPYCARLFWRDGRLAWDDPEFGSLPLTLDAPATGETATRLIQKIGAAAKAAARVEVPFDFIAPGPDSWWTGDSRAEIDIPLGKAGALRKQHLALGHGTSQHVLIAGRTGSGKSTLMHAMIANLALVYSPDEIDLYLIDFKKGVEFKTYATHQLPHASVVAIESEREFGVSVLQRLDAELKLRADRFRDAGVQDIQGYRNAPGTPPLPRVLLIVDEFQEFFAEEDKVSQEAAALLDRLVRQGRAFGVHVILGSQSLAGAFTLARSTLGQMAVRIALQCGEVDSHLILAENNTAAKLLSRPGEAIYNDANGAPEGNHVFQVVWLSERERENRLRAIRDLAETREPALARSPIVFEGDAQADLARNPLLRSRLEAGAPAETPRSAPAWLGDPVAIKEPTAALFRRQGGNHLLIVGQNEEAALGVVAASLLSLAAQYPPATDDHVRSGARFWLLDGTPEDGEFADALRRVAEIPPHGVRFGDWRDAPGFLAEVAGELDRRKQPGGADGPELFLFIHDLARFRDLRRREDDFGFGPRDEEAGPPELLDAILRDGAGYGVHLIAWCDTVNNLNRHLALQQVREFEMRVLFQMSPTDSSHLLDNPAASKLGPNRALYFSEERNLLEKFRPYRLPEPQALADIRDRLRERFG